MRDFVLALPADSDPETRRCPLRVGDAAGMWAAWRDGNVGDGGVGG